MMTSLSRTYINIQPPMDLCVCFYMYIQGVLQRMTCFLLTGLLSIAFTYSYYIDTGESLGGMALVMLLI